MLNRHLNDLSGTKLFFFKNIKRFNSSMSFKGACEFFLHVYSIYIVCLYSWNIAFEL